MFIGSEVRLEGSVSEPLSAPTSIEDLSVGQIDVVGFNTPMTSQVTQVQEEITGLVPTDSSGVFKRVIIDDRLLTSLATASIADVEKQYETLRAAELRTSPTFDADSSGAGTATTNFEIDFSNNFSIETFDQDKFEFFPADSDRYWQNFDSSSLGWL